VIKSVAIFGDSWSAGCYEKIQNPNDPTPLSLFVPGVNLTGREKVLHNVTFQSLFSEHNIKVQNFSVGGCSNNDILQSINKRKEILKDCGAILICQTDPIRNFFISKTNLLNKDKASVVGSYSDLNELAEQLCKEFYQSLSNIQKQINTPFVLFTGCSILCEKYIAENLNYISPCWTKIVDPTLQSDCYFGAWERALTITDYLIEKFPQNANMLKESFFNVEKAAAQRSFVWQTNENFGWVHPAEGAYHKMFDKILQKIGEINDRSQTSS
jgi:hypothetical protein